MRGHRLLFVSPRRRPGLAPIYLALLLVVALGAAGFGVALWPRGPAPSAHPAVESYTEPAGRSYEGGLVVPAEPRRPRRQGTWM